MMKVMQKQIGTKMEQRKKIRNAADESGRVEL